MAYVATKRVTKNGKTYEYKRLQESYRVGKKVKTRDLGPVNGKKRRGGISLSPLLFLPVYAIGYAVRKAIDPNYKTRGLAKHKEQGPDPRSLGGNSAARRSPE
jgi:hypothetical protein